MRKLLLPILLLTLISCQPSKKSGTSAFNTVPASELAKLPMKWNSGSLPLKVYQADSYVTLMNGDQEVSGKNLLEQMELQWNAADPDRTYFDLNTRYSNPDKNFSSLDDYLDSEIGIYKSTTWFNNIGSGVLAVTSYLAANKGSYLEMIHGDIIVNFEDFLFTNNPADATSAYDLPSVLLHELGHLIGVKHTNSFVISSVMKPSLGQSDVKRNVYSYDVQAIRNLYNNNIALTASPLAIIAGDSEPVYVKGYIELRADGSCHHFIDDQLVNIHMVDIIKK